MAQRKKLGFIIFGTLLLMGGLYYGTTSHQVNFQSVGKGTVAHYLSGDHGSAYIQMSGSDDVYIVPSFLHTIYIKGGDTLQDGDTISFVYRTDGTTYIDGTDGITHLSGDAYSIIELTYYVPGGNEQIAEDIAYGDNPNGFYQNNWPTGGEFGAVGLVILLVVLLLSRRKKRVDFTMPKE